MGINMELVHEVNNEIERATAKWGEHDKDLHKMLNGVTEELLEVVHAVNHQEGSAKVHEEIVHAIGVLVRLDEMAGNLKSRLSRAANACLQGGEHEWGIDGMHSNEFCKKCFVSSGG